MINVPRETVFISQLQRILSRYSFPNGCIKINDVEGSIVYILKQFVLFTILYVP